MVETRRVQDIRNNCIQLVQPHLGLAVERGVLDVCLDEHPQVVLDVRHLGVAVQVDPLEKAIFEIRRSTL